MNNNFQEKYEKVFIKDKQNKFECEIFPTDETRRKIDKIFRWQKISFS